MNVAMQVLHVLQKDLRRFWPGLLGIAALGAYHRFFGLPPTYRLGIPLAGELPIFSLWVIALAAAVVQDDPATSPDAHWRTTPLHPGAVFAAKSVFLGVFLVLVPAALQLQWVASLAPVTDPAGLFLDAMLFQGGMLAAAALAASITPNLGAFLTLALAGWVGLEFFESTMLVRGGERWPGAGEMVTRTWGVHLLGLTLGMGLFFHQYLTRHLVRTVAFAVAGFGLGLGGLGILQPDRATGSMIPVERVPYAEADAIELRMQSIDRHMESDFRGMSEVVTGTFDALGPRVLLLPKESEVQLTGPSVNLERRLDPEAGWDTRIYTGADLPGMKPVGALGERDGERRFVHLPIARGTPSEVEALRGAKRLQATVGLDVFGYSITSRMHLRRGATRTVQAGRFTILSFGRDEGSVTIELRRDVAPRALEVTGAGVAGIPGGVALYNRNYGAFLISTGVGGGRNHDRPRALTGGARHLSFLTTLTFEPDAFQSETAPIPDDWLDDVELLIIDTEYLGSFERTIDQSIPRWPEPGERISLEPRVRR